MKITKYGHCCLLIETKSANILTDPGKWSQLPDTLPSLDIILITHEHADHMHIESMKELTQSHPDVQVVTNSSVGKVLDTENISYTVVADKESSEVKQTLIEGFGTRHAEINGDFGQVENTGYFIDNHFFYPGDAFTHPGKEVSILALPVAGPFCQIKDVISYLTDIAPEHAFPVHDEVLSQQGKDLHNFLCNNFKPEKTNYTILEHGKAKTFE